MKQQATPAMIGIGIAIGLTFLGLLFYLFLGSGSDRKSDVASPYGLPKPGEGFKTPPPGGSGRNTITGEPLPEGASHPRMGFGPGAPDLPPGAKVLPDTTEHSSSQPSSR